jgi:hypothetical protein
MPPPSLTVARDPAAAATTRHRKVHPTPGGGAGTTKEMGAAEGWARPEWCSAAGAAAVLRRHPAPALFGCGLLLFMAVEYTIPMVRPDAPPLDLGFVATRGLHAAVAARPWLNSLLAALNTVSAACPDFRFLHLPFLQCTASSSGWCLPGRLDWSAFRLLFIVHLNWTLVCSSEIRTTIRTCTSTTPRLWTGFPRMMPFFFGTVTKLH